MQKAICKARAMLSAGAYVHQYEQHDLSGEQLAQSLYTAAEVVNAYDRM
jgi:hypothetical protein